MSYFPDIVREVMERVKKNSNQEIATHVVKVRLNLFQNLQYKNSNPLHFHLQMLQYNVPGGKKYRGMIAVQMYEMLAAKDQLTEENLKLAALLGWMVEFVSVTWPISPTTTVLIWSTRCCAIWHDCVITTCCGV